MSASSNTASKKSFASNAALPLQSTVQLSSNTSASVSVPSSAVNTAPLSRMYARCDTPSNAPSSS
jgi:hypothetical protein